MTNGFLNGCVDEGHLKKALADPSVLQSLGRLKFFSERCSFSTADSNKEHPERVRKILFVSARLSPREAATAPCIHIQEVKKGNVIKYQHWGALGACLVELWSISVSWGDV